MNQSTQALIPIGPLCQAISSHLSSISSTRFPALMAPFVLSMIVGMGGCTACQPAEDSTVSDGGITDSGEIVANPEVLEACQEERPAVQDVCLRNTDCDVGYFCSKPEGASGDDFGCCITNRCVEDGECLIGEYCDERRNLCIPVSHACVDDPALCTETQCLITDGESSCEVVEVAEACRFERDAYQMVSGGELQPNVQVNGLDGSLIPYAMVELSSSLGSVSSDQSITAECETTEPCTGTLSATVDNAECTASLIVFPSPSENELIVVVTDDQTGVPVENATVIAQGTARQESLTSAQGTVTIQGPVSFVTAISEDRAATLIATVEEGVVALALPQLSDDSKIAGVKGTVDVSNLATRSDVQWALSGLPLPMNPLELQPSQLFGQWAQYEFDNVLFSFSAVLPYGMSFGELGPKPEFVALGDAKPGTIWTLAAPLSTSEALAVGLEDDGAPIRFDKSRQYFSYAKFGLHGIGRAEPGVSDAPVEPGNDLPIPYNEWSVPEISSAEVAPDTYLSETVEIGVPPLPCLSSSSDCDDGEHAPAVLLMMTAAVPGQGLIPLGFNLGYDQKEPTEGSQDGEVEGDDGLPASHLYLDFAPPHDGLEGLPLYLVAMALANEPRDGEEWQVASMQVQEYNMGAQTIDLDAFVPRPSATVNVSVGSLVLERSEEADLDLVQLRGSQLAWDLLVVEERAALTLEFYGVDAQKVEGANMLTVQSVQLDDTDSLEEIVGSNGEGFKDRLDVYTHVGKAQCRLTGDQCATD